MQTRQKKIVIYTVLLMVLGLIGWLGYTSYQLKEARDGLAEDLKGAQNRNQLLNQKYKEKKAEIDRLQREALLLKGQISQAKMEVEKLQEENEALSAELEKVGGDLKKKLASCEEKMAKLLESHKKLRSAHVELKRLQKETSGKLKFTENELKNTTAELRRMIEINNRYREHNVKLSEITKELVGRIEKRDLGTSILVREPVVQFSRVELEEILQEYLDKIDEEKIIQ